MLGSLDFTRVFGFFNFSQKSKDNQKSNQTYVRLKRKGVSWVVLL